MSIITLTTDLGNNDFYLASLKAKIYAQLPGATIVDISHHIEPFHIATAAFVLKSVMGDFPKNTIHIAGVGNRSVDDVRHLGISYLDQYILTADNGFFSLIASQSPGMMVELDVKPETDVLTFPIRDLYAPAAVHLARGGTLEMLGRRTEEYVKRALIQPVTGPDYLKGVVIYVDHYGNAISNITTDLIRQVGKGREFLIGFTQKGYEIDRISKRYSDVVESERLALINSAGHLEIAINQGHAANLLGLNAGETIIMSFYDD